MNVNTEISGPRFLRIHVHVIRRFFYESVNQWTAPVEHNCYVDLSMRVIILVLAEAQF